jgi:hypothetical protein
MSDFMASASRCHLTQTQLYGPLNRHDSPVAFAELGGGSGFGGANTTSPQQIRLTPRHSNPPGDITPNPDSNLRMAGSQQMPLALSQASTFMSSQAKAWPRDSPPRPSLRLAAV